MTWECVNLMSAHISVLLLTCRVIFPSKHPEGLLNVSTNTLLTVINIMLFTQ